MILNKAMNGDGGFISILSYVSVNMTNINMISNEAGNNGGCMSFENNTQLNIYSSKLHNNIAGTSGGIVYMKSKSNLYTISNTDIRNNTEVNVQVEEF